MVRGKKAVTAASAGRKLRAAIYTRKSTEEGLEQEFNSLDAQYEACAAYITSQRHEGWTQVKERYDDAATVRHIYDRYLALGSGNALFEELQEQGYRTKIHKFGDGVRGGGPFATGGLYHILSNPIYIGKVVHHEQVHEGQHEPIIEQDLWDAVQAALAASRIIRKQSARAAHSSPLVGLLVDGHGRRMNPSHAVKNGQRYRYYITHRLERTADGPQGWRVSAHGIEQAVIDRLRALLIDAASMRAVLPIDLDARELDETLQAARQLAERCHPAWSAHHPALIAFAGSIRRRPTDHHR